MKFKQDDKVAFDSGSISGIGFIKGKASSEQPVIGSSWIIQVLSSDLKIPNNTYPFDHIVLPEIFIKLA